MTKPAEVKSVSMSEIVEGLKAAKLDPGHYMFFVNDEKIDIRTIMDLPREAFPKNMTGGWIIACQGSVEDAVKIFRMEADKQ